MRTTVGTAWVVRVLILLVRLVMMPIRVASLVRMLATGGARALSTIMAVVTPAELPLQTS
ncbi:MAG: hypothetical protein JKY61_07460 [Planctomycetes bacterium]|nr:hypothetical protein [Planctomycetota bacterium]